MRLRNNKSLLLIGGLMIGITIIQSCDRGDNGKPDDNDDFQTTPYTLKTGQLQAPSIPADNPLTEEGVFLGRMLFYEKSLSKDNSQSCASCHRQEHAFTDTAQFSIGVEGMPGKRQAMSVFNTAWHTNEFFWDGRAHLLRDQALLPIQDPLEMNESLENVVAKLESDSKYPELFAKAFGSTSINSERISKALEQFMNSIVSIDSKYDQYLAGNTTLTDSEERGRQLFFAEYNQFFPDKSGADCAHCHATNAFENDRYMNNGLDAFADLKDDGRMEATQNPQDKGKFKVTSLRNIELTAPYMHDGRFKTLEEVVDHYNNGIKDSPTLDPALKNTMQTGLMLDAQDKADLIAFMKTLTDYKLISNPEYTDPH